MIVAVELAALIVTGWWHNLGIAYQRESRIRDAATAFRRAFELDPADSEARDAAKSLESHDAGE